MNNDFSKFGKSRQHSERVGGKNCVIYTRVSSSEQTEGYSLDIQKREIEAYCLKNSYIIVGCFGGVYESAKTDEREEFNKMLTYVKRSGHKVSYIITHYLDRFSRSGANAIYIANELRKLNIKIISVVQPVDTDTASGRFQQNIQFLFSELENDNRRERCTSGMKQMLEEGYWPGKVPMGYSQTFIDGKQVIKLNDQGTSIKKAFQWKAEDRYSNLEIRLKLKANGVVTSRSTITKMFKNPFYCGMLAHKMLNGRLVEGKHEKMISQELFMKINSVGPKNPKGKHSEEFDHIPLKTFIKCSICNEPFTGYIVRARGLWYYKCRTNGCNCNKSAKELNSKFETILDGLKLQERFVEPIRDQLHFMLQERIEGREEVEKELRGKLTEIQKKLSKLEEKFILDEIGKETYSNFKQTYVSEKELIMEETQRLQVSISNIEKQVEKYIKLLLQLPSLWKSSDYKTKRSLQNIVFPEGILFDKEKNAFRTSKINSVAFSIASLSRVSEITHEKNHPDFGWLFPSVAGG